MRTFARKSKPTPSTNHARPLTGRHLNDHLQRRIGNQAVQHLLPANATRDEQEASRVANQVMRLPEPQAQPVRSGQDGQTQIQARSAGDQATLVHNVTASPGQPLDPAVRAFFEPRFGYDFSQVRIHTDAPAAESAQAVNAQAYTLGNDVVFGQRSDPRQSPEGLHLLAHELAHVVQQRAHGHAFIQRQPLPTSTNYRFDTYRVTEQDLSDPDIVARFNSLPINQLIQYRDQVADFAVIEFIDHLLDDRLDAMTLDQLFKQLATEKDPAVRSYVDQWLAAHAPTSSEIAVGSDKPGQTATAMNASGISVTVLPDEFVDEPTFKGLLASVSHGHVSQDTKAITYPEYHIRYSNWNYKGGRVTSVSPAMLQLKIKTVFLRGTSRIAPSGYGVGTRPEDVKAGRTTLAHHEGSHAACFIRFLKDNAPPTFDGKKGDTVGQIIDKEKAFGTAIKEYYQKMVAHCGPAVDCTGQRAFFCP